MIETCHIATTDANEIDPRYRSVYPGLGILTSAGFCPGPEGIFTGFGGEK